jgi:streptomycin 6-kinase
MADRLAYYMNLWNLQAPGEPFTTDSGLFLPVSFDGSECMLKIARREKDKRANGLMIWWNGAGAAKVLAHDKEAILMERAVGDRSLVEMARTGSDLEAAGILCDTIAVLHAHNNPYPATLVPLSVWFGQLAPVASDYGGILTTCSEFANLLLTDSRQIVALHGDIHHRNVLDFRHRGWLAIDPKGLLGNRAFDYANMFYHPDEASVSDVSRLTKQADLVTCLAGIDRNCLLQWVVAWAGLIAACHINDKKDPQKALHLAKTALSALPSLG